MWCGRYRSRADFDEGDIRLRLPRFSEENFPKNLVVTDAIKAIADKNSATSSQVTLAWILAEHKDCESSHYDTGIQHCVSLTAYHLLFIADSCADSGV